MDITVVKSADGDGGKHRCVAVREDGAVVQFTVHPGTPPHDLCHYALERHFGVRFGFWGLLAAGASFEAVQRFGARDPRSVDVEPDPVIAAHVDELLAAEALVNDFTGHGGAPSDEMSADDVAAARAAVSDIAREWAAVEPGGKLQLVWET